MTGKKILILEKLNCYIKCRDTILEHPDVVMAGIVSDADLINQIPTVDCMTDCSNLPYFFSALAQSIAAIIAFSIAAIIFYKKRVEEQFEHNIRHWIELNKIICLRRLLRTKSN